CGGVCIDTTGDTRNCGGCGVICPPNSTCQNGHCITICAAGLTNCGGNCVNTSTDTNNCGACGVVCPPGKACVNGVCGGEATMQLRYVTNLDVADSIIDVTNSGASGNICVNVYAFSPDEQLVSCCACLLTPNQVMSFSARNDLIADVPLPPTSLVVKLVATQPNRIA